MDAVEFMNQVKRICDSSIACRECPLYHDGVSVGCMADVGIYGAESDAFDISGLVEKVEKWAKEHPPKTRQRELLKLIPNAKMINGAINVFPCLIDPLYDESSIGECNGRDCDQCRRKYWLEEIE